MNWMTLSMLLFSVHTAAWAEDSFGTKATTDLSNLLHDASKKLRELEVAHEKAVRPLKARIAAALELCREQGETEQCRGQRAGVQGLYYAAVARHLSAMANLHQQLHNTLENHMDHLKRAADPKEQERLEMELIRLHQEVEINLKRASENEARASSADEKKHWREEMLLQAEALEKLKTMILELGARFERLQYLIARIETVLGPLRSRIDALRLGAHTTTLLTRGYRKVLQIEMQLRDVQIVEEAIRNFFEAPLGGAAKDWVIRKASLSTAEKSAERN